MRNLLPLSIVLLLAAFSCTKDFGEDVTQPQATTEISAEILNAADVYYDHELDAWMRPIKDPYTLENFQRAYDNIVSASSPYAATLNGVISTTRLEPTHYHIRIKPKTIYEIQDYEELEGVVVGNYPFDVEVLPDEQAAQLTKPMRTQAVSTEGRYIVDTTGWEQTDTDEPVEPYMMGIFYAVWPVSVSFPDDMDYEILYDVFLPDTGTEKMSMASSADLMTMVEKEAIRLAKGVPHAIAPMANANFYPNGTFLATDQHARTNTPIKGVMIRVKYGSKTTDVYTDTNGRYNVPVIYDVNATVTLIWEGTDWKICNDNGKLYTSERGKISNGHVTVFSEPLSTIHRACYFWFKGSHGLNPQVLHKKIMLKYYNYFNSSAAGTYSSSELVIRIYRLAEMSNEAEYFGTVGHELGHANQDYNNSYKFKNIDPTICESYAVFTGWRNVERYYATTFGIKPYAVTRRTYQDWNLLTSQYKEYTPLFIDLYDDYNQCINRTNGFLYPNDNIKNVPISVIQWLGFNTHGRTSLQQQMQRYVGVYYSQGDLYVFLDIFLSNWKA